MEQKNPFNEARKARRIAINARNSELTKKSSKGDAKKKDLDKEKRMDLASKDQISPKGLYI